MSRAARGAIAGAAGTLAMDLVWYRRYRSDGGQDGFLDWDLASGTSTFEQASAPAKFARKAVSSVGVHLPDRWAAGATNVMHWLTGSGYGAAGSVLLSRTGPVVGGIGVGTAAWLNSYATLGAMGLYEPIWEYEPRTLAKDLSAHLAYGLATGLTYRALRGRH